MTSKTAITKACHCFFPRFFSTTPVIGRLKAEWRVDRRPADTRLSAEDVVEQRKAFGGYKKWKAVNISKGKYVLESQGIEKCLPILDVLYSAAGKKYSKEKIMVKGAYILVDASDVKDDLNIDSLLDASKESDVSDVEETVKANVIELLNSKKLIARITSRPGQVGNCNGVIVEGKELIDMMSKVGNNV